MLMPRTRCANSAVVGFQLGFSGIVNVDRGQSVMSSLVIDLVRGEHCGESYSSERSSSRNALFHKFSNKLITNSDMSRALVSFQANKDVPFYRWMKYKEGFSSAFVAYALDMFRPLDTQMPAILDPFAGAGTTLTTAGKLGWEATGIELLPVGVAAMRARICADSVDQESFSKHLDRLRSFQLNEYTEGTDRFPHIRITRGAFPEAVEIELSAYAAFMRTVDDPQVRYLFWFACLSSLEEVSYTRKDGQYLRWDPRSGKAPRSKLNKGNLFELKSTLLQKLGLMQSDIGTRNGHRPGNGVSIIEGSCLEQLPKFPDESFHLVVTSPPYCNRYDYSRTYALELAFMGYGEDEVRKLRQTLLSATVENKSKKDQLSRFYESIGQERRFADAVKCFETQHALWELLNLLYRAQESRQLNNSNIPKMVENYFFEMTLVVWELSRVLKPGGRVVMVNDNVQYHGEEVPVDLILSDVAEQAGLFVDKIWVLPRGKGNSSQQMGMHGRKELRKCVYVWTKPDADTQAVSTTPDRQ